MTADSSGSTSRDMGDIATKLLFENDRVRIWEMRLAPWELGPIHEHNLDQVLVQVFGDRMAVKPQPDTKSKYNEYVEADVEPGNWFYVEKGGDRAGIQCRKTRIS